MSSININLFTSRNIGIGLEQKAHDNNGKDTSTTACQHPAKVESFHRSNSDTENPLEIGKKSILERVANKLCDSDITLKTPEYYDDFLNEESTSDKNYDNYLKIIERNRKAIQSEIANLKSTGHIEDVHNYLKEQREKNAAPEKIVSKRDKIEFTSKTEDIAKILGQVVSDSIEKENDIHKQVMCIITSKNDLLTSGCSKTITNTLNNINKIKNELENITNPLIKKHLSLEVMQKSKFYNKEWKDKVNGMAIKLKEVIDLRIENKEILLNSLNDINKFIISSVHKEAKNKKEYMLDELKSLNYALATISKKPNSRDSQLISIAAVIRMERLSQLFPEEFLPSEVKSGINESKIKMRNMGILNTKTDNNSSTIKAMLNKFIPEVENLKNNFKQLQSELGESVNKNNKHVRDRKMEELLKVLVRCNSMPIINAFPDMKKNLIGAEKLYLREYTKNIAISGGNSDKALANFYKKKVIIARDMLSVIKRNNTDSIKKNSLVGYIKDQANEVKAKVKTAHVEIRSIINTINNIEENAGN